MRVFVDTSAWLALYDRTDQHHRQAVGIAEQLKVRRAGLVISTDVFAESLTIIRYRLNHASAVQFGRAVLESHVAELLEVEEAMRRQAWEIFQRYADKAFSFVDCTSFALMAHAGLEQAFTFDRHFTQYGLKTV